MMKTYKMDISAPPAMEWDVYEKVVKEEWHSLLSSNKTTEPDIQKFLENHPCMVPGWNGRLENKWPFPAALICQPVLPDFNRKIPDFMWIANSNTCITPVLIEIERPDKKWFTSTGKPTEMFGQARDQLVEWRTWFSSEHNKAAFRKYYKLGLLSLRDKIDPLYVLIYGRRENATRNDHFAEKRADMARADEVFMTFDRLFPSADCANFLSVKIREDGYYAITVPPTVKLGPGIAKFFRFVEGKGDAAERSPHLSKERKEFLIRRFRYWDDWVRNTGVEPYIPQDEE